MPPKKKLKTEDAAEEPAAEETTAAAEAQADAAAQMDESAAPAEDGFQEAEAAKEVEQDDGPDKRATIAEPVAFLVPDMTLNVMPATVGGILMPLNEGALQYFLAGARANVGVKSGRYMFEVKILETLSQTSATPSQARTPMPPNLLRIGFSTAGSVPLMGDTEESICFDSEGKFLFNKKATLVSQKLLPGCTIAVMINLTKGNSTSNTISLFKDGERIAEPQALPESLHGKLLFPTVTFKNITIHANFGPEPHVPLPFKCRMLAGAAKEDVQITTYKTPKDGKHEVLFPVLLPDEGAFDWIDWFLSKNPEYTELSDRKIVDWAVRSGLWRPKTHSFKTSNDKPDMNFGIQHLDDGSVKQILNMAASVQKRHFVVAEIKGNLTKQDRLDSAKRFFLPHFNKVAQVMVGTPSDDFKQFVYDQKLKEKQEKSNAEFVVEQAKKKNARFLELRQKQVEKARKAQEKAERAAERQARIEAGEEVEEAEPEEEEADAEMAVEEDDSAEPPKVELTPEEMADWFRKGQVADLSALVMSASFPGFSYPEADEGFDKIEYKWNDKKASTDHLKNWIHERKMTTRIEELQPSEWFREKWQTWQKDLQGWHTKHMEAKDPSKRAALAAAKAKEAKPADENKDPQEADKEADPLKLLEAELERQDLDIFGVQDVCDIGEGEPLFANFSFEDWALLSLRFELHMLVHAFKHDCGDAERTGFNTEHLAFYYNKYYKKGMNPKNYGVDTVENVLAMIKDTTVVCGKVIESQVTDDLETNEVFVKLTEEARRERQRRIDSGDESAQLKFSAATSGLVGVGKGGVRPPMQGKMGAKGKDFGQKGYQQQMGQKGYGVRPPGQQQWGYGKDAGYGKGGYGMMQAQRPMMAQPYGQQGYGW
mmetsp:Transcript_31905/g.94860  ORF Transcript_31905/g.94860 Transcript_31905/m.94860 type:complete len:882 (-) Transcript_31905:62-2707(-)